MTRFLDRTFSVPMPGKKGDWPWDKEPSEKKDEEPPEEKPEDKEPE